MFRGFSDLNIKKKLICRICKYVEVNIPIHHEKPMKWKISGAFEKIEYLCCEECDYKVPIILHCNVPMFYSESEYNDTPNITKKDFNNINDQHDQ
ncbi:MAG: hypothetical protein ACXWFB_01955 [Nitrososphaeraceae archaeon]